MKELNRSNFPQYERHTNRVIQFGEGNFLRCFVDWQIDILNEKNKLDLGITVIRPIDTDYLPLLNVQDGLYTTLIRGINENGDLINDKRVIRSINEEINIYKNYDKVLEAFKNEKLEFIFSNTTEAGIIFEKEDTFNDKPQKSFPGKLTKLLYERFKYFNGDKNKGLTIIPCELIDYNGEALKEIVLKYSKIWNLELEFEEWLKNANIWCSSLVDRIVTGYPKDEVESLEKELGYKDKFMVAGEYFHLFVIQGPKELEERLKLQNSGLNILVVDDIKQYKERKVAILNGAHTAMVPVSYLYGLNTVKESLDNKDIKEFLEKLIEIEIIPSLSMDSEKLKSFAKDVIKRFSNPYVKHELLSISLNSMFKYKTRILPQFLTYIKNNKSLPKHMVFSLAALICFYKGKRAEEIIPLKDEEKFLKLFAQLWGDCEGDMESYEKIAETILGLNEHWEIDLNEIEGLSLLLGKYISLIDNFGVKEALKKGGF